MSNLKILHISDLHYSDSNKSDIEYIKKAIFFDVDNFINKHNLIPDFIIFSGDLVFKPDNEISSIKEFQEAYDFFIKPLLDKLGLTNDDIFITSGNHDINRKVITRKDTIGLCSYTESKKIINELITEIINKSTNINHLKQFNSFINTLETSNIVHSNDIFQVHKKTIGKINIGIVNLNSTILSFLENAYGELIIGEEQLKLAYKYIENCDIKIANVHHSVNWLVGVEQQLVKQFYYQNFNLVFIGHEHMEQPELVNFNDEDTLIINSASIFQGRNNVNGYSLFDYSFDNKSMDIYIREYDDRATKFSTVTFKDTENKYNYEFNILEKSKTKKNIELILDKIKTPIKSLIRKELLINTAKNENNFIEDIFVEPNIYTKSEFIDSESKKELYTINKIIYSSNPIILKGIESSGKTTLLNFLANEYLNIKSSELKIPILLNYLDIKEMLSESLLFSKTIDFLRKLNMDISNKELESLLRDGNLVFLIDNFTENDNDIKAVKSILASVRFKKNKYIFTAKEEIFNSIEKLNESKQNTNNEFTELFLYNLKREKAREFFQLYFKNTSFKNSEFEGIYKFISKLNIPLTIFNYTLIAHVYDNQRNNFKPINEAYLLDVFMENLLEKLDIAKNLSIGSLGYNLKSSYLIYIAKWMVNNNLFNIEKYKLQEITSKFIQELKREKEGINIESFIDYMEQKGIFVNIESNKYRFRYKAFLEFFIAKGMEKDDELKELIIDKENYLNYKNEIRYYSGLHGEDDTLIVHLSKILSEENNYFNKIKKNDCKSIYMPDIDIEEHENICIEQISHSSQDKRLEVTSSDIQKKNNVKTLQNKDETLDKRLFQTNVLLSMVIRNSEQLRNPTLKTRTLLQVTQNLSIFFQNNLNKTQEFEIKLREHIKIENIENISENEIKEFSSILNIVFSQAFMSLANNSLSSESLFTIYDEILDETDDDILKLLIISTFIHSENSKAINLIKKTINDEKFSKNRFLMMALFFKIYHSIKVRDTNDKYKNKLESFLTDILVKIKYNELSGSGLSKTKRIEGSKKTITKRIKEAILG